MLRARPVALSVTLIAALAAAALPSTALAKPVRTVTFDHPGVHTWQVPRGVRFATFDVFGAMGGSLPGIAFGGLGAHVRVTIAVPQRGTLTILVGGAGGSVSGRSRGAGGFNGGAPGGDEAQDSVIPITPPFVLPGGPGGGGGGGASDVRTGPAGDAGLASRLIVAGGGGGAGEVIGGAGGLNGEDGADGPVTSNVIPP